MTAEEFAGLRKRLEIAEQKLALIDAKHEPLTPEEFALGQNVADRIEREHALIVAAGGTHKSLSDSQRSLKQAIADLGALERIAMGSPHAWLFAIGCGLVTGICAGLLLWPARTGCGE
jgi:hypothetical protein